MYPEIAGVSVYYPINALAIIVSVWGLAVQLKRRGFAFDRVLLYITGLVVFGVVGAKLYSVVVVGGLRSLPEELAGGYRYPGALLGVLYAAWTLRRLLPPGLTLGNFLDCWVPGFSLALAIGRIACLLHGCCHGAVCSLPWAIRYPKGSFAWYHTSVDGHIRWSEGVSAYVHPLPLYSASLELFLFGFCLWLLKRRQYDGQVILAFLAIHGPMKAAIEFLRYEYNPLHQVVFPIGILAAAILVWRWARPVRLLAPSEA